MRTYIVTASDESIHDIEASGWENYDGSVDFFVKTEPGKRRVTHFFYKPISVLEAEVSDDDQD